MKILRIFDVSAFVHAGAVNKRAFLLPELEDTLDKFRERRIYCGGASLLWNTLYYEYGKCDMVFCCDRRPTIKQEMYELYKYRREHKEFIGKSKEATEYILNDCGFDLLYGDGYEADDFIYSIVRDMKTWYDHIYVYTGDSDMYFLVSDNVSIEPSSSRSKTVNMQNFTYTVKKDEYTPYNALTFYKILYGDKGDDIPPMSAELCIRLKRAYDNKLYYPYLGDKESVLHMLSNFGPEAVHQGELVFPLDVRVPTTFSQGDKLKIAEWGDAFKNRLWVTGHPVSRTMQDKIETMAAMGMSVDKEE